MGQGVDLANGNQDVSLLVDLSSSFTTPPARDGGQQTPWTLGSAPGLAQMLRSCACVIRAGAKMQSMGSRKASARAEVMLSRQVVGRGRPGSASWGLASQSSPAWSGTLLKLLLTRAGLMCGVLPTCLYAVVLGGYWYLGAVVYLCRLPSSQMTGPLAAYCLVKAPPGIRVQGSRPAVEAVWAFPVPAEQELTAMLPSWPVPGMGWSGGHRNRKETVLVICTPVRVRMPQCRSTLSFRTFRLADLARCAL